MSLIEEFHRQKAELIGRNLDIDFIVISDNLLSDFITTLYNVPVAGNMTDQMFGYPVYKIPTRDIFRLVPSYD